MNAMLEALLPVLEAFLPVLEAFLPITGTKNIGAPFSICWLYNDLFCLFCFAYINEIFCTLPLFLAKLALDLITRSHSGDFNPFS